LVPGTRQSAPPNGVERIGIAGVGMDPQREDWSREMPRSESVVSVDAFFGRPFSLSMSCSSCPAFRSARSRISQARLRKRIVKQLNAAISSGFRTIQVRLKGPSRAARWGPIMGSGPALVGCCASPTSRCRILTPAFRPAHDERPDQPVSTTGRNLTPRTGLSALCPKRS
jgi:hypothetical protein